MTGYLSKAQIDAMRPGEFMREYLRHVRDDHGHAEINLKTPWQQVIDLHAADHKETP